VVDDHDTRDKSSPVEADYVGLLDPEKIEEGKRLVADMVPIVVHVRRARAALALHVGNDVAVGGVEEGNGLGPGVPALGKTMEHKDDWAIRVAGLDIMPADAARFEVVVFVACVDRLMCGLIPSPEGSVPVRGGLRTGRATEQSLRESGDEDHRGESAVSSAILIVQHQIFSLMIYLHGVDILFSKITITVMLIFESTDKSARRLCLM
jgi:hypothetical protein